MRRSVVQRWTSLLVATHLTLVPTISSSAFAAPPSDAPKADAPPADAPKPNAKPKTATKWLTIGETRESEGDFAGAGEAYRNALEAMSEKQRRANEGALAAMYSADAYWLAFEGDNDAKHLQAGFEALDRWLQLVDPEKPASLQGNVEWRMARLRSIYDPMLKGDAALKEGNVEKATDDYKKAIAAMDYQKRRWELKAHVGVHAADANLAAYDQELAKGMAFDEKITKLEAAKNDLEEVRKRRPMDDKSDEWPRVEERMAKIQARIDEANRLEAQRKQREAEARYRAEQAKKASDEAAADAAAEAARLEVATRQRKRTVSIALLTTGAAVTAAGAGLLGEGVGFGIAGQRRADEEATKANAIDTATEEPQDLMVDRPAFDPLLQTYRDDVRAYSMQMTVSGAVISGLGLAAVITGAVILSKNPRRRGKAASQRAMLTPVVSPSQLGLSLTARFR